jgi:amidase
MFEEALERADQLDKEFAATGQLRGKLHGVPISLKDQINVEGFDSTIGFTKFVHTLTFHLSSLHTCRNIYFVGRNANHDAIDRFVNQPAAENALVVDRLIEEGAIPFTKTNVPQSYVSAFPP